MFMAAERASASVSVRFIGALPHPATKNAFDVRVVVAIVRVLGFDEAIGSQVQA